MPPTSPPRVLVVDDDPWVAVLLCDILRRQGYAAEMVHNGALAISALDSVSPDVVILDFTMPGVSGSEVLAAIRHHPTVSDIPVVVLSAYPSDFAATASTGEADAYLQKPFGASQLLETIGRVRAARAA